MIYPEQSERIAIENTGFNNKWWPAQQAEMAKLMAENERLKLANNELIGFIEEDEKTVSALEANNERLRAALRPFVEAYPLNVNYATLSKAVKALDGEAE